MNTNIQPVKLLKYSIVAALIIVINLLCYYLITTFYTEPQFEAFCPNNQTVFVEATTCVDAGGQWAQHQLTPKQVTEAVKNGEPLGWCDATFTCNKEYTQQQSLYHQNVFMIMTVIAIIIIMIGVFIPVEILSISFSWAGVLVLLIATMRYWSDANNWLRLIILAIALGLLIWLVLKKFKN